jgi:hypothetical protein
MFCHPDSSDSEDEASSEAVGEEVPKGVYLHKQTGKYRIQFSRVGKKYKSPLSTDINWLVEWKAKKDKELDEVGVPPTRKHKKHERAAFQSETPGVKWHSATEKWHGKVYDRIQRKDISTKYVVDEAECADVLAALRAEEKARFEAEVTKRMEANPKLADLPRAPSKAADATPGTVYWHIDGKTKYVPYRAVVSGKGGVRSFYVPACQDCHQMAKTNVPKGAATHCVQHGGGKRCKGHDGSGCPLGMSVDKGKRDIYDGRCARCFLTSFPNDPRAERARKSVHAREHAVLDVLSRAFPDYNWVFDKAYGARMTFVGRRFRPDARVAQGDRVLIVEVDEQSHRGYLCAKEREREESFVKQNRNKTVVMIRFNPDSYTDYAGFRHPSCFTDPTNDNQCTHVHPKRKADWQARTQELIATVRNLLDPKFPLPPKQPDRPLLICELFYDDVMATPEDRRVTKALAANKAIGKRKRE